MPHITARDGTRLYYEEAGSGSPVIFVHEYAGDYRTWEMQMRFFSRAHRCITYSQRGYPPSDVPKDGARYSQDIARDDVLAVMDALKVDKAHVVGHSMGAYTALHVGIRAPARCISVVAAGCGWGSSPGCEKARRNEGARRRDRQDVCRGRHRGGLCEICRRADAPGTEEQGSARLRRIRPHVVGAFRGRACAHHVQSPAQAADAMGDGERI